MAQLKSTNLFGTLTVFGNTNISGKLDINNISALNASFGSLNTTAAANLNGTLTVSGATVLNNTLTTNGATTLNNTLTVSGATSLNSTLRVSGATTLNSTVTASGLITGNNGITVNNAIATFNKGIKVVSGANLNGTVTINGDLTVTGSTTVVNATNLAVQDQLIELAKRSSSAAITGLAGFYINKYDGTNAGALVFDNTGTAYVGDVTISNNAITASGSLQPLATRTNTTLENSLVFWNGSKQLSCNNNISVSANGTGIISPNFYGNATSASSATVATSLATATAGSSTQPVYFSGGKPVACNTTLGVSITGNAGTATSATKATSLATSTAGSSTLPVYFSGGKPVATSTTLGVSITGNASTATTATYATRLGSASAYLEYENVLPKITYEYNKEINFGGDASLCCLIGEFPMYDSGVVVDINSTTHTTYHGILVLATQNAKNTQPGTYTITVYGDANNTITSALYIYRVPNSNVYKIYFKPATWSKNSIHIKVLSPNTYEGNGSVAPDAIKNICTSVTFDSSLTYLRPTNALTTNLKTAAAISADKIVTTATSSNSTYYIPFVTSSATVSTGTAIYVGNSKAFTFNPSTGVVSATTFNGNATSATTATKSTQIAITGKNTGVYNLGLLSASTTTTTGSIYGSSTKALQYNTSTGTILTTNYGMLNSTTHAATMYYNSTDECIEFVIL